MKVYANNINICGGNVNCCKLVAIRHQNDEVTSVTHIEDLERHFLEEDLCDNNDDGDSAN